MMAHSARHGVGGAPTKIGTLPIPTRQAAQSPGTLCAMGLRAVNPPPSANPRGPVLFVFVREDERQTIRAAARAAGAKDVSQWVRRVLDEAARKELTQAA